MFSIFRRRWVLIAVSSAVFLVSIQYLTIGLGSSLRNPFLDVYPLGTDLGWLVLAFTVVFASWHIKPHVNDSGLVDDRELRYGRVVSVGIGVIALGWATSTVLIGRDEFIRRIGPYLIPLGYMVIAGALLRLATKSAHHGEQRTSRSYPVATRRLLIAAGFGIGVEAVAYLPALRDAPSWLLIVSYTAGRAAGFGVVGVVLLVAARQRASWAPLAAIGIGLLVVMTGTGLQAVAEAVLPWQWHWPISLSFFLTGTGYFVLAVTAAYAAVRTESPRGSRRRIAHEVRTRVTPERLWVG
jgi:uncharacterized integral membrane protein